MTTHSSILAWRIPWTEEPGELQSIGSQSQIQLKHTCTHTHFRDTESSTSFQPAELKVLWTFQTPSTLEASV